jgi:DNA-binding transcriptional ArsR family regulator
MVEYTINIDAVFSSLADATRRDILTRVSKRSHSIGELAESHPDISFAAVAKHVGVLEEAKLVIKMKEGRYQIISVNPKALEQATRVLEQYKSIWEARYTALDTLLK